MDRVYALSNHHGFHASVALVSFITVYRVLHEAFPYQSPGLDSIFQPLNPCCVLLDNSAQSPSFQRRFNTLSVGRVKQLLEYSCIESHVFEPVLCGSI